ncbi:MAG TPA: hypothetical protein VF867_00160 [Arthrobacter sp.]
METITGTLEQRVAKVLAREPTPFHVLERRLPGTEPSEIREALLRLNAAGVADIAYGHGWHLKVGA